MKAVLRLTPGGVGMRVSHDWWSERVPAGGSPGRMKLGLGGQQGAFILEVLIGSIIVGIALVGLGLLFAARPSPDRRRGQPAGRTAPGRAATRKTSGRRGSPPFGATEPPGPCPGSKTETVAAGESGALSFTRTTCAYYVDNNTLLAAGGVAPPSPCVAGAVTRTLRVTVTVQQVDPVDPTKVSESTDPVTLEAILVDAS